MRLPLDGSKINPGHPHGSTGVLGRWVPLAQIGAPTPFTQKIRPDGRWTADERYPGLTLDISNTLSSQAFINCLRYSGRLVCDYIEVKMRENTLAGLVEVLQCDIEEIIRDQECLCHW